MFKKILRDTASKVNSMKSELERVGQDPAVREKIDQLAGGAPLPFSGLLNPGERSSSPRRQTASLERRTVGEELPRASVRDAAIEAQILSSIRGDNAFPTLDLEHCILCTPTWEMKIDADIGGTAMIGRCRWVYVAGRSTVGENIVKYVFVIQAAHEQSTRDRIDDPKLFEGNPFVVDEIHPEYFVVPDEAMAAGIQMRVQRILTPMSIHNRMMRTIKVQSINTAKEDHEEIRIPPRTKKVFNYLKDCDVFSVRDAESSKLLKSYDPTQPGFGFEPIEV